MAMAETEDVESLSQLLASSGDADIRAAASLALAIKEDPAAALELLRRERHERDPNVLSVIARALGRVARKMPCIASETSDRLLAYLDHGDASVRRAATIGLTMLLKNGQNRDLKAVFGLARAAYADEDALTRYAAAEGLYEWGVPHLEGASGALRHAIDRALFSMLRKTLEACAREDLPEVQRACSKALATMGGTA